MGKIMEWLRDYWLVGFIVVLSLMATEIFGALTGWWSITNFEERIDAGDLLRSLILCIVGMGGAYGLHLATKRQERFSKQVQVQIDQSFNEKLGRGVELLAKKDASMRSTGIRVLVDLFNNANEEQKTIIANIIYDFFHEKARSKYGENGERIPILQEESRQDVQAALDYLIGLPLDERDELLQNRLIHYGRLGSRLDHDGRIVNGLLNFRNLDFSFLEFKSKMIERIGFSESYFNRTRFGMRYTDASRRTMFSSLPPKNTIRSCNFNFVEIKGTIFYETVIELSFFYQADIDFENTTFTGWYFWEMIFHSKMIAKLCQYLPSHQCQASHQN